MSWFVPVVRLDETDLGSKERTRKAIKRILGSRGVEFQRRFSEYIRAVRDDAKRLCHVDTGALQASIRIVEPRQIPKGYHVAARDIAVDYQIVAGGPPYFNPKNKRFVDYAQAVHDGTFYRAGRPFLSDAVALNSVKFDEIGKEYTDWVGREWSKD